MCSYTQYCENARVAEYSDCRGPSTGAPKCQLSLGSSTSAVFSLLVYTVYTRPQPLSDSLFVCSNDPPKYAIN